MKERYRFVSDQGQDEALSDRVEISVDDQKERWLPTGQFTRGTRQSSRFHRSHPSALVESQCMSIIVIEDDSRAKLRSCRRRWLSSERRIKLNWFMSAFSDEQPLQLIWMRIPGLRGFRQFPESGQLQSEQFRLGKFAFTSHVMMRIRSQNPVGLCPSRRCVSPTVEVAL